MEQDNQSSLYHNITHSLGQLLALAKLYDLQHPVFSQSLKQLFIEISGFLANKQPLVFSISGSGELFLVNGQQIEFKEILTKRFAETFRELHLGSLELEPGIDIEEFKSFVYLLSQAGHLQGEEKIKQYLKEKGVKHIIVRFVTYKLVQDNEKIVKDGQFVSVDELPLDIKGRFSKDLNQGVVSLQIKKEERIYQILAHDPNYLSQAVSDFLKDKNNTQELSKILWLVGDYLIDEIGTARQEELNRKVLEEIKNRLLALWEKRQDKEVWEEETHKTFTSITAALQLKGLFLLYKKHKKELEAVGEKLRAILETLPPESQLYQKAIAELKSIGLPSLPY